jgi:hypothetical protein
MKKIKKSKKSKVGRRIGAGRPRGARNKSTVEREAALAAAVEAIIAKGETVPIDPVDLMLHVMRHPDTPLMLRCDMAKAAAPHMRPKLQSIAHGGKIDIGLAERLFGGPEAVCQAAGDPGQWQRPSIRVHDCNPQLGTFAATPTPPGTPPSPHRGCRPRRRSGRAVGARTRDKAEGPCRGP